VTKSETIKTNEQINHATSAGKWLRSPVSPMQ